MKKKHSTVKVRIDGHHQLFPVIGEDLTLDQYPEFKFSIHLPIKGLKAESNELEFYAKGCSITEKSSGLLIVPKAASRVEAVGMLFDVFTVHGTEAIKNRINAIVDITALSGMRYSVWSGLQEIGFTAIDSEIDDFLSHLISNGYEIVKIQADEKVENQEGSPDNK